MGEEAVERRTVMSPICSQRMARARRRGAPRARRGEHARELGGVEGELKGAVAQSRERVEIVEKPIEGELGHAAGVALGERGWRHAAGGGARLELLELDEPSAQRLQVVQRRAQQLVLAAHRVDLSQRERRRAVGLAPAARARLEGRCLGSGLCEELTHVRHLEARGERRPLQRCRTQQLHCAVACRVVRGALGVKGFAEARLRLA